MKMQATLKRTLQALNGPIFRHRALFIQRGVLR